jgi:hypothetical protein
VHKDVDLPPARLYLHVQHIGVPQWQITRPAFFHAHPQVRATSSTTRNATRIVVGRGVGGPYPHLQIKRTAPIFNHMPRMHSDHRVPVFTGGFDKQRGRVTEWKSFGAQALHVWEEAKNNRGVLVYDLVNDLVQWGLQAMKRLYLQQQHGQNGVFPFFRRPPCFEVHARLVGRAAVVFGG